MYISLCLRVIVSGYSNTMEIDNVSSIIKKSCSQEMLLGFL